MKFQSAISCILIVMISSCRSNQSEEIRIKEQNNLNQESSKSDSNKIQVLNFGTFHMGLTSDATKTEFDEHDIENQKRVHEVAKMLSDFKPTVILVETSPEFDNQLQLEYNEYLKNPKMFFNNPSEIELLAYELGRICETKRIYGIDHKMEYNYKIGNEIANSIDAMWYDKYYNDPLKFFPEVNVNRDTLNLHDQLKLTNHDSYLDFLITVNADMLTHAGTKNGFEGADEATRFYQRNLRMYSNMNRIDLSLDDRVFILMGASHTAFFRDFISRSPKYEMVNTFQYLK